MPRKYKCVKCGKKNPHGSICNKCLAKMGDDTCLTRDDVSSIMGDVAKEIEKDGFVLVSCTERHFVNGEVVEEIIHAV